MESLFHVVVSPLAGTLVLTALAGGSAPLETAFIAFVAFLCAAFVVRPEGRWTALLPFMAVASRAGAPVLGVAVLAGLEIGTGLPDAKPLELAAAALVTAVASAVPKVALGTIWKPDSALRVAVIGSEAATRALSKELELAGVSRYTVTGRVRMADEEPGRLAPGEIHDLGGVEDLSRIVREGGIHLLIMTGEVPRLAVFNEIARSCLEMPVRLQDLSGFYEEVFGHVPVAEINASWFQYIMHPRYRPEPPPSKRVLDLAVAVVMGALFLPLLGFLALLIKRDGGPAFFKQVRIGDGGQPFTVYKLRTMTVGAPSAAQWASVDDPRITKLGRILRKSHLDEFPQLINVFRGEMSIVGPRPEQPEFVEQLEGWVPYYSRRHLLKPGITGWAQVRCGYAGSDVGSAWKLCHDLYYLKHRSTAFDLIILGETIRTLFADRQYAVEPKSVSFILNPDRILVEASPHMAITSAS